MLVWQAPRLRGINAVRLTFPRCWFDAQRCERGVDALKLYRSEWDETLRVLRPGPVHDWTSHAADAFRTLAMGLARREDVAKTNFNRTIEYPRNGLEWGRHRT